MHQPDVYDERVAVKKKSFRNEDVNVLNKIAFDIFSNVNGKSEFTQS